MCVSMRVRVRVPVSLFQKKEMEMRNPPPKRNTASRRRKRQGLAEPSRRREASQKGGKIESLLLIFCNSQSRIFKKQRQKKKGPEKIDDMALSKDFEQSAFSSFFSFRGRWERDYNEDEELIRRECKRSESSSMLLLLLMMVCDEWFFLSSLGVVVAVGCRFWFWSNNAPLWTGHFFLVSCRVLFWKPTTKRT